MPLERMEELVQTDCFEMLLAYEQNILTGFDGAAFTRLLERINKEGFTLSVYPSSPEESL